MKAIIAAVVFLLAGCSTPSHPAQDYAIKGQTESAYSRLTYEIHAGRIGNAQNPRAFVAEFPEVLAYGNGLFTEAFLADWISEKGNAEWINYRLSTYCATNSADDCAAAIQRVKEAEKAIRPNLKILKSLSDGLSKDEIAKLSSKYTLVFLDDADVGIVMDRQVQNMSTAGSNAGTVVGAAAGSAAYNINSVSSSNPKNWTYSPAADLGSTILGAIIGSAANTPAVTSYMTRYTIKTRDSATKYEDRYSDTPIGQGVGVCVNTRSMEKINQEFCTMSLSDLKQWVAKQS